MSSVKGKYLFYLSYLLLLCGVLSKDIAEQQSKESANFSADQSPDFRDYHEHFRLPVRSSTNTNFTGIRSAFQWRVGKTLNDGGINNIMLFSMNDTVPIPTYLSGRIGIYSNGSQFGVYFSMDWSVNFPYINCSNNFSAHSDNLGCFNSNYSLISNAIYILDVEISGNIISGYISEPQADLTYMNDTNLPRKLIAEIQWLGTLINLKPEAYSVENNYGSSCDYTSEITTFNYPLVQYNNEERVTNTYRYAEKIENYFVCGPEKVIAVRERNDIGVYISRPPEQINSTSTDKNSATSLQLNTIFLCFIIFFVVLQS